MTDAEQLPPHLLIRADASIEAGTGHVMRMIALGQAYQGRGGRVTIAAAVCPERIRERVAMEQIDFSDVGNSSPGSQSDAESTIALARSLGCSWVVLDGYHFGIDYQRAVRAAGFRLLVVDDHGYSDIWAADAILNQNIFASDLSYVSEVEQCRHLLGTRFALLRREFRVDADLEHANKQSRIDKVLVTLGGTDPTNVTGSVLEALNSVSNRRLEIKAVVGAGNPNLAKLRALAESSPHNVELLLNVHDMPALYRWADGVISAGGSTCWEWLFYGLPACVISIADNQEPIVSSLAQMRTARSIDREDLEVGAQPNDAIGSFLTTGGDALLPPPASLAVDAKGADRVAAFLDISLRITIATAPAGWLRPMTEDFAKQLRGAGHLVRLVTDAGGIESGDILLLLSFWGIIPPHILAKNTHNLVVHASALPEGRGWSPLTWQILENRSHIPVTLLEAGEKVDSGAIYDQVDMEFEGHELLDELRCEVTVNTIKLCQTFIDDYPCSAAYCREQAGKATYYPRRRSTESQLNPNETIVEQFNLLRTVDNESYPAFFDLNGHRYILKIEKDKRLNSES